LSTQAVSSLRLSSAARELPRRRQDFLARGAGRRRRRLRVRRFALRACRAGLAGGAGIGPRMRSARVRRGVMSRL
jgi:hypothetical protein